MTVNVIPILRPFSNVKHTPFGIPLITIFLPCLMPACGDESAATIRMQRISGSSIVFRNHGDPNRTFGPMLNGRRIWGDVTKKRSATCENPVTCFTQNKG